MNYCLLLLVPSCYLLLLAISKPKQYAKNYPRAASSADHCLAAKTKARKMAKRYTR